MSPKIIELKQAPVVLVELPEIPLNVRDTHANGFMYNDEAMYLESFYLDGICEDSKLVGILSDLTEDQLAGCVDKIHFEDGDVYKDYRTNLGLSSAKESFQSLLESENVYTENPYVGKLEPCGCMGPCGIPCAFNKWQEAQSRTIDITRTIILLKK